MKKLLIYAWLPCLLAMFMSATFASCSDDDDDETTTTATGGGSIVGTWKFQGYEGEWDVYGNETTTFKADGTFISTASEDGASETATGKYTYDAEKGILVMEGTSTLIYIDNGREITETETSTEVWCVKVTSDTLIMWEEGYEDEAATFKRIG